MIAYSYIWYHFKDRDVFEIKVYLSCIENVTKTDEIPLGNDGQVSTFVLVIQAKYPLSIMTII